MIRKLTVLFTLILTLILITPSVVYAGTIEDAEAFLERLDAAENNAEGVGLNCASKIWMTKNIDLEKGLKFISKWMIWDDDLPYIDDTSNDDVSLTYEIKGTEEEPYLLIYFKKEIGGNTYGRMSRVQFIESYDNAEYIIVGSSYDCYTICVDGNTYKGDLGLLLSDAIKQQEDYDEYPEISMAYDKCTDIFKLNGWYAFYKNKNVTTENLMSVSGYVGFDLTVDSYTPVIKDNTDDDYIYGGDENNKLDSTPTQPGEDTDFNVGKIIGYVISAIIFIVLAYVIYILVKQIMKILKK